MRLSVQIPDACRFFLEYLKEVATRPGTLPRSSLFHSGFHASSDPEQEAKSLCPEMNLACRHNS